MSNSIEERIKEFRGDPQKMDVATNFVNEVVEKAKNEALSRMNENDEVSSLFYYSPVNFYSTKSNLANIVFYVLNHKICVFILGSGSKGRLW